MQDADDGTGRETGGFRLLEVLGQGGTGVVCRAVGPDGGPAAVQRLVQVDGFLCDVPVRRERPATGGSSP